MFPGCVFIFAALSHIYQNTRTDGDKRDFGQRVHKVQTDLQSLLGKTKKRSPLSLELSAFTCGFVREILEMGLE